MLNRYCFAVCFMLTLFLCASCARQSAMPAGIPDKLSDEQLIEKPDRNLEWNGFHLIREDFGFDGRSTAAVDITVPENVLTNEDRTLTFSIYSRLGSDTYEYGVDELIQVHLDGIWYTIPQALSQNTQPLVLGSKERKTHTADLSPLGVLPPGRYRLVEKFFYQRLQNEDCAFAYFWVVQPNEMRPPGSETTGEADMEDILFSVESLCEARRILTDRDTRLSMVIENLSGKGYYTEAVILEGNKSGKWKAIKYQHANMGFIEGWTTDRNELFFDQGVLPFRAGFA